MNRAPNSSPKQVTFRILKFMNGWLPHTSELQLMINASVVIGSKQPNISQHNERSIELFIVDLNE